MKHFALAALIAVALAAAALAATSETKASVRVTQIKATGSGGKTTVDPKLKGLADKLPQEFKFSRYDYISSESFNLAAGKTGTAKLANGHKLDITPTAITGSGTETTYTLKVVIYHKKANEKNARTMTCKIEKGDSFLVSLGESKDLGGTLILAIKVQ